MNLWVVTAVTVLVGFAFLFGLQVGLAACNEYKAQQQLTYTMQMQNVPFVIEGLEVRIDNSSFPS